MSEAATRRILAGRYEIVGVLGRGGMGTVYRGRDLELGRPVAIKVLQERLTVEAAAVARFRREAQSAARLTHPNVVTVYDSGVDHGDHYIVMELVAGGTLKELLRERGRLPVPLALALEDDILRALAAAHEAGLVHRDVSPGNVMVTRDGTAKVTDFGVARAFGPDAEQTGSIAGTAAYLAPEQAAGEAATPAADLYGAGCVLYAMLTGRPPFAGDNALEVAARHRDETPAAPSALRAGLPPAVDALALKALQKRPQDRFASARDMRRAIEGAGVDLPAHGSRDAWPAPSRGSGSDAQTSATRVAEGAAGRGDTAIWPGAAAGMAGAAAGVAGAAGAARSAAGGRATAQSPAPRGHRPARSVQPRPRPTSRFRRMSRPMIAVIAALVIAAAVLILLAATGVLFSSASSSTGVPPGGSTRLVPAATTPATTAPATATPRTTAPAPAGGAGGNPGKGHDKTTPGKGKKKGQTD